MDGKRIHIAMEYLKHGDLRHYLQQAGPLEENHCKTVIFQVMIGLMFMHRQQYTHRDIAPKVHLPLVSPWGSSWLPLL